MNNKTYIGKKFKVNQVNEIWKVLDIPMHSTVPGMYTVESVVPPGLSFEVLAEHLHAEFDSGRFEWLSDDTIDLLSQCRHIYKKYVGFTEVYHYCTKCNNKEKS